MSEHDDDVIRPPRQAGSPLPAGWVTWHSPSGVDHVIPPRGSCATCGRSRHGAPYLARWPFEITSGDLAAKLAVAAERARGAGISTALRLDGVTVAIVAPAVTELNGCDPSGDIGWTDTPGLDAEDEDEAQDREIIRAKWKMDGATTLHEAAEKLRAFAATLDQLHAGGWTLDGEIGGDHGFISPPAPVTA